MTLSKRRRCVCSSPGNQFVTFEQNKYFYTQEEDKLEEDRCQEEYYVIHDDDDDDNDLQIDPPYTSPNRGFIGLSILVTCTKPWAKTSFVHTVLLMTCTKPWA